MLRLTGGEFRGRSIQTPGHGLTRPTQAKLRQALFNSLQTVIADARLLDLFAGAGTLGFEALSRGASHVTFVESNRTTARMIEKNAATLGVQDRIKIIVDSVESVWSRVKGIAPYDLVLADPPYAGGWEMKLLSDVAKYPWGQLLSPGGHFSLEWGAQKSAVKALPEEIPLLVKVREKNYGDSILTTYKRSLDP